MSKSIVPISYVIAAGDGRYDVINDLTINSYGTKYNEER